MRVLACKHPNAGLCLTTYTETYTKNDDLFDDPERGIADDVDEPY
jgi:hypothetical protein